jgi:hypothetical protein
LALPRKLDLASLSERQKYALKLFYAKPDTKVKLNKAARTLIDKKFKTHRNIDIIEGLENIVPAFYAEMTKAIKASKNLQPAVFSECVYAQALAEKLDLSDFSNHNNREKFQIDHFIPTEKDLKEFNVRYSYSHGNQKMMLIQAGGKDAVDCALVCKDDSQIIRIELKEPYARSSEPNLPKYGEDGLLVTTERFTKKNPQFTSMLNEHLESKFNVFEHLGNNVGSFKSENIKSAITDNYAGDKFADVICTEDSAGYLVMLPANHVSEWARLEGEIRPTGRNSSKVWTPIKLQKTLDEIGAQEIGDLISVDRSKLTATNARGSDKTSRYKINPLFFIRESDIHFVGDRAKFKRAAVKQNIPSISAKMNFDELAITEVRRFYEKII